MLISKTPLRISFVGGGSDLPSFYREHGGAVVSMAIQKYFYLSMHPLFEDDGYLLKYSRVENCLCLDQIKHKIIKQVFSDYNIRSVDFASAADIPAGTGLASSSSFTVSLITLCNAYLGIYESKETIATKACAIEIDKLGEPIGKQDQYACALGGLNLIQFHEDDSVSYEPIFLGHGKERKLTKNLLLFNLNKTRSASSILKKQNELTLSSGKVQGILSDFTSMALELSREIQNNIDCIGDYLHEAWMKKREISNSISDKDIDEYYTLALEAGAIGGKVLGAGGGGFLMFYIPELRQQDVRDALSGLGCHQVKMDKTGTSIIFDDRS